jgi:hypothetical protein
MAFLAEVGAEQDAEQQSKTRWSMSYKAAEASESPDAAAPAPADG